MITLAGSTQLTFTFPAEISTAIGYYRDIERSLKLLPHISIVERFQPGQYRMLYNTQELGIYDVRLFCDIQVHLDQEKSILTVAPWKGGLPVASHVSLHSLTAQGSYSSQSIFHSNGETTRIDYALDLKASLPIPLASRLIPASVLNGIAHSIACRRIQEIAQGFINSSVEDYCQRAKLPGNGRIPAEQG